MFDRICSFLMYLGSSLQMWQHISHVHISILLSPFIFSSFSSPFWGTKTFSVTYYLAWALGPQAGKILCDGHKVITQRLAHQAQRSTMLTPGHTLGQSNVSFSIHPSVPFYLSLISSFPLSIDAFSPLLTSPH